MDTVILTMLGLMGSWNIAVTFWMLRTTRNNKKGNPHPHPSTTCGEHGRTLVRIETTIETMRTEAKEFQDSISRDLVATDQAVAILWNKAHPGRDMPKKR